MTLDEFNKVINRHKALNEYNQAFHFCIANMSDDELRQKASDTSAMLLKAKTYEVLDGTDRKRNLTVPLDLTLDWIVDTAISLGYHNLERGFISTGLFSSVPCIVIGSLMAKQKFGVRKNKDNTYSFLYSCGSFASDFKLLNALVLDIIKLFKNKYNES